MPTQSPDLGSRDTSLPASRRYSDLRLPTLRAAELPSYAVRAVASTNVTIAGGMSVDGVSVWINCDAVLLTAQTTTTENGIWIWQAGPAAWSRLPSQGALGVSVYVSEGTAFSGSVWQCSAVAWTTAQFPALTFIRVSKLTATKSLNFGATISAGDHSDLTIPLTGAVVGRCAIVNPQDDPGAGCSWSCWISAANTVTVRLSNPTTGTITLTTRIWRAEV